MAEFQALIEKERERLTKLAEDYHAQIAEIQGKLAEVHREMRAITAYEEAKLDKPAPVRTPRAPRTTSTGTPASCASAPHMSGPLSGPDRRNGSAIFMS